MKFMRKETQEQTIKELMDLVKQQKQQIAELITFHRAREKHYGQLEDIVKQAILTLRAFRTGKS